MLYQFLMKFSYYFKIFIIILNEELSIPECMQSVPPSLGITYIVLLYVCCLLYQRLYILRVVYIIFGCMFQQTYNLLIKLFDHNYYITKIDLTK